MTNQLNKTNKYLYISIHTWIRHKYGSATKCTSENCKGKSKIFDWCKLKEKEYDYNINNFVEMCRSCHRKYDMTEDIRKSLASRNGNKNKTHCINNHPLSGDNLLIRLDGSRRCRECARIRVRKHLQSPKGSERVKAYRLKNKLNTENTQERGTKENGHGQN